MTEHVIGLNERWREQRKCKSIAVKGFPPNCSLLLSHMAHISYGLSGRCVLISIYKCTEKDHIFCGDIWFYPFYWYVLPIQN